MLELRLADSHLRRSHTCGTIVPCQSAQTSKLVSYVAVNN